MSHVILLKLQRDLMEPIESLGLIFHTYKS